jgi:ABC-2 type transport system ATP-binding protein
VALVLDEPFSGLDPVGVDALAEVLAERASAGVPVVFSSHQLELVERLCDAVAIIRDGHLVAKGTVDELRARGGRGLWRVRVDGASQEWAGTVAGAEVVADGDTGLLVRLPEGGDEQALLRAAQGAGRVRRFAPEEPRLVDLFREVAVEAQGEVAAP